MITESHESRLQNGLKLAESWSNMPREKLVKFGYGNYPDEHINFLEGVEDDVKRSVLATLMENYRRLYEDATTTSAVSTLPKYVFPLIRATFANIVTADLFSLQALTGPVGQIFFFDVIYGSTKGNVNRGDKMFDALAGPQDGQQDYTSEKIDSETVGTGTGAVAHFTGNLSNIPIRPGSIQLTDGTQIVTDDGAGALVGDVNALGANTINYETGAFDVTFAAAPVLDAAIVVDYYYDMERSTDQPEVEIVISSTPVTTQRRRLRAVWSSDAEQDLAAVHGVMAESEIIGFISNEIQKEKYNYMVRQARTIAPGGYIEWDSTTPLAVSEMDHRMSLIPRVVSASNRIFTNTQRVGADWLVVGPDMSSYIEALPSTVWTPTTKAARTGAGVHKIGSLTTGQDVYKDPAFPTKEAVLGHKGDSFLDAGIVEAIYVALYQTDVIRLDDFRVRVGLGSRTAIKVVNSRFYSKMRIV